MRSNEQVIAVGGEEIKLGLLRFWESAGCSNVIKDLQNSGILSWRNFVL